MVVNLENIARFYNFLSKHFELLLDKMTKKDVERFKRHFYNNYKIEPSFEDISEIKKNIVMKKSAIGFLILFLIVVILLK